MNKDTNRVASLIHFAPDVDIERVRRWIKKLEEQGHVTSSETREYNPNEGSPVWYIP